MEVDIGADGKVMDLRVVGSGGPSFDEAALAAVRQFEFSPAEVDGVPAPVRIGYSYEFLFREQRVVVDDSADAGAGITLSGRLVERGTRESVGGATIAAGGIEAVSNSDGTFKLEGLAPGPTRVVVVAPESMKFETTETLREGERTEVVYLIRKKSYGAFETVVRDVKERKEVAQVSLRREEIRLIPGTNGDAFKVVQNLPGVARSAFGLGFLVVRGSKPWDTRTYIDGTAVPLLFHFGGLFATFNSNLLDDITFQAGNFGAEFGRSIGGLVKGGVRTPSQSGYHGYVDINLIDASAMLEGPLSESWAFAISARRSWIDVLIPWAVKTFAPASVASLNFVVAPRYYDYQARLEYKPKASPHRFFVQFFGSDDKLRLTLPNPAIDPEGRGDFGTSVNYNRLLLGYDLRLGTGFKFTTRTSVGLDHLDLSGGADVFVKGTQYPIMSRNTFSLDLTDLNLALNFGADLYLLPFQLDVQRPPTFKANQIPDPYLSRQLVVEKTAQTTFEPSLFVEGIWTPTKNLKFVAGLRGDYETYMNKGWVDPRFALFLSASDVVTLKTGFGIYHQPPDYRQGLLSPVFGNPKLLPEGARHFMVGSEVQFTDAISLDVQLYYKDLFWQARPTLAPSAGSDTSVSFEDVRYQSTGTGRSFGAEFLLRHQLTRNFFGWISYSLSRTERDYSGGTQWGLSAFDQTHNLIVVASYKFPYDFIMGARFRYTTGPLNTPFVGSIYDANGNYYFPLPGNSWSRRLPNFVQLDLRLDKRFVFDSWMLALYLDIQNVTNQQNVEGVANNFDYSKEQYIFGLPILPSLGIRGEW